MLSNNIHKRLPKTEKQIDDLANKLDEAIQQAMNKSMKPLKIVRQSKRYWNDDLKKLQLDALRAKKEALLRWPNFRIKLNKIRKAKKTQKLFQIESRKARTEQWNNFLEGLSGTDIWKVQKYIKPNSGRTIIPQIQKADGTLTETIEEKRDEIWKALLPEIDHGPKRFIGIEKDERWAKLTTEEVEKVISQIPSDKAPGEDGITGRILKAAWKNTKFQKRFFRLLRACMWLGYHPKTWREGIILVIPKPHKPDYSKPRAYRPISLLKVQSKVLEKIVQLTNGQTHRKLTTTRTIWRKRRILRNRCCA